MSASTDRLLTKPLLFLILGLLLAGCGGNDDPSADDRATEANSPATEASANGAGGVADSPPAPTIGEIVWATEIEPGSNRPVDRVDRFADDATTIYAVLPVTGLPVGTIVRASWTYNDTTLDSLAASATIEATSDAMIWIEFHLTRDSDVPWPDGTYAVSIAIGETERRDASVEVVAAE